MLQLNMLKTATKKSLVGKQSVRQISNIPKYTELPNTYNRKTSSYKPKIKYPKGLIYHPAPSAPSQSSATPDVFLPDSDPRKGFNFDGQKINIQNAPAISNPAPKKYNLKPEDVAEIQRLRLAEPYKYTKKALAEKFNVSQFTISLVSDQHPDRKADMDNRLQTIRGMWRTKKIAGKKEKVKRQVHWYRDE